jgi:hypothetical protein
MSQRPYRNSPRRPPARRASCLSRIAGLGVALLVIIALYGLLARPAIGGLLGAQLSDQLAPSPAAGQAAARAAAALPGLVAALPPGQVVLSEEAANAFLAEHQADYAPVERIRVRFVAGQVVADVSALGVSGVARTGLTTAGGRVALLAPTIDGALGLAISGEDLAAPLVSRLNAELESQGKQVSEIRIEDGQIVLVTSGG